MCVKSSLQDLPEFLSNIFFYRGDVAREGRFISTFIDLVDSFMPNFQASYHLFLTLPLKF